MAEYQSRIGKSGGLALAQQNMSIVEALRRRYDEPGNPVLKLLSTLQIPQQAMIGMIREAVERQHNPDLPKESFAEAAIRGVADPRTSPF
jgi:hypothetical protein